MLAATLENLDVGTHTTNGSLYICWTDFDWMASQ